MDGLDEVFQVDWFGDVAVGMQAVSGEDVPLGLRGGQDYNRNSLQVCIGLDLREDLPPIFSRQVTIKEDEVGLRYVTIGAGPTQEGHRLSTVLHYVQTAEQIHLFEGFLGHQYVGRTVFDKEDL